MWRWSVAVEGCHRRGSHQDPHGVGWVVAAGVNDGLSVGCFDMVAAAQMVECLDLMSVGGLGVVGVDVLADVVDVVVEVAAQVCGFGFGYDQFQLSTRSDRWGLPRCTITAPLHVLVMSGPVKTLL